MDRRVGTELNERGVLVWYDPARVWLPWIQTAHGENSSGKEPAATRVTIGGRDAHLVVSTGSHYEVLQACEALVGSSEPPRLLVYVPGEPYLEMLSPLRELECLGGEKEPFQRDLTQVARQAFQSAGLPESKIDELLNRDGLDFDYVDSISVGNGDASPLAPVFGSSRELDVLPSFLAEPGRRAQAAAKGLLPEVAQLASQGLGLQISPEPQDDTGEVMAQQLARALLVAEMRSDLSGPEPVAISQVGGPASDEQVKRVRAACQRLRREYPDTYESLAEAVEQEFGLAQAGIDPETLGQIDTFRFEEQHLLEACDRRLAAGDADHALTIVEGRLNEDSYWVSVSRYPARHAAWEAGRELARLAIAVEEVTTALKRSPDSARAWVEAYTAPDGWHHVDQLYREARYRLRRLEDTSVLVRGKDFVFARYEALLERMATGFVKALQSSGWQVEGVLRQEEVFKKHVSRHSEPVAYLLADAMRFEMGVELGRLIDAVGATAVRIDPAVAVAPTITELGMAALSPGAEQSFSVAETSEGITGIISGKALVGSKARMDYAKGAIPALVEMTMDRLLHDLTTNGLAEEIRDAPIVIVRSQEIDGIGEGLPSGVAQKVMGTILEDFRSGVQRLADAGIRHFVVAADHGHVFGQRRGDDMKIDPPKGGTTVDLHRRCWVGRGGDTPSSCVRLTASDLGYGGTDLELVVPKGMGIFKAGGSPAFHHGGLSLQELIIPVVTFDLKGRVKATRSKALTDPVALEGGPEAITNRIFSVNLRLQEMVPTCVQVRAVASGDGRTVGHAAFATSGWDDEKRVLTLTGAEPVSVGIQLDDDEVEELRVVVVEVGTQRTLKDSSPIPVRLLS
jgi:hypothetical protein